MKSAIWSIQGIRFDRQQQKIWNSILKKTFFLHMCAMCFELPFHISTWAIKTSKMLRQKNLWNNYWTVFFLHTSVIKPFLKIYINQICFSTTSRINSFQNDLFFSSYNLFMLKLCCKYVGSSFDPVSDPGVFLSLSGRIRPPKKATIRIRPNIPLFTFILST